MECGGQRILGSVASALSSVGGSAVRHAYSRGPAGAKGSLKLKPVMRGAFLGTDGGLYLSQLESGPTQATYKYELPLARVDIPMRSCPINCSLWQNTVPSHRAPARWPSRDPTSLTTTSP